MKTNIENNLKLLQDKKICISFDHEDHPIHFDANYILNKYYGGLDEYIKQIVNYHKDSPKFKDTLWLQPSSMEQLMDEPDLYQINSNVPVDKNSAFKYINKKISIEYDTEAEEYISDDDQMIQYGYLFYEDNKTIGYSLNVINHICSAGWVNNNTEALKDNGEYHITTQDELDEITYAFALGEYLSSIIEENNDEISQTDIIVDGFKNIYYFPKQKEMVIGINNLDKDTIGIDKIFEDTN